MTVTIRAQPAKDGRLLCHSGRRRKENNESSRPEQQSTSKLRACAQTGIAAGIGSCEVHFFLQSRLVFGGSVR